MEREKVFQDIGNLEGQVLVFGGAYSNLQALEKIQQISNDLKIEADNIIFTGDSVAYCAQPEECVQLLKEWGINCIAGNVEIQLREEQDHCGCDFLEGGACDTFSKQWYPYLQRNLSNSSMEWMKALPDFMSFNYSGLKCTVVHGSMNETAEFIFKSTKWEKKAPNFTESGSDIILAGHSGLPFEDLQDGKFWLNAGVIGMPANDFTNRGWYLILNIKNGEFTFQHHGFEYDHILTAYKIGAKRLPASYGKTLTTGVWDNCDILPEIETKQTGKRLHF